MDQRGHGRDQVDPAVMPHLRCQRGAPSVHAPRVQFEEFDADAADAEDGAAVVADQPAGEADQDRTKVVSHGRFGTFQAAEVAVAAIDVRGLSLIARLRTPPAPA